MRTSLRLPIGEIAHRLPLFGSGLTYFLLYWLAPEQIIHWISIAWESGGLISWAIFILPVIFASLTHIIILSTRVILFPLLDSVLSMLPIVGLSGLISRAELTTIWFPTLILLIGFGSSWWIIRLLISRQSEDGGINNIRSYTLYIFGLSCICWISFIFLVLLFPIAAPRFLELGVITIGLGFFWIIVSFIILHRNILVLYFLLIIFSLVILDGTHELPISHNDIDAQEFYSTNDGFVAWLRSRNDLADYREKNRPYPVIIAASEGGGIYAAAHAYLALSGMRDTCPNFAQHLFATVGISGGAIGNLLYAAASAEKSANGPLKPCHARRSKNRYCTARSRSTVTSAG